MLTEVWHLLILVYFVIEVDLDVLLKSSEERLINVLDLMRVSIFLNEDVSAIEHLTQLLARVFVVHRVTTILEVPPEEDDLNDGPVQKQQEGDTEPGGVPEVVASHDLSASYHTYHYEEDGNQ